MNDTITQPNIPTRTNNPGDLKYIGQKGASKDETGFASFPTPQEGFGALLNDIQYKINKNPKQNLADFANTYAPKSDGNNTAQYAANLANQLHVAPNTPLSELQPKIGQFADAIAHNEGYQGTPVSTTPVSTQPKPSSGIPLLDVLLGAGAAGLGWAATHAKALAGAALTDAGAGVGAALGGPVGAIIGETAGTGLGNAVGLNEKPTQPTQNTQNEKTSGLVAPDMTEINQENEQDIQSIENTRKATEALSKELQTTPTGKLLASDPKVQDALGTMAQYGYLPDTENGLKDFGVKTDSGAFKKSWSDIADISQGMGDILGMEGLKGNPEEAKQNAYNYIERNLPQPQWEDAKKQVDKSIETVQKDFGKEGGIPLDKMEKVKQDYGRLAGKWDVTLPSATRGAYKALNRGFRNTIYNTTGHKELYGQAMKEEQKIFTAQKLMKKMDGKKALEHKGILRGVLKSYGKYIGTYLGDKIGGPLGAIVGTMVGDYLTHKVDKKFGKTFFESKEGKALIEMVGKRSPRAAKLLKAEIIKYGNKAEAEARKKIKGMIYKEKKKGIMEGKPEEKGELYIPEEKLPNIVWGKSATPKKKKSQKGLLTIR